MVEVEIEVTYQPVFRYNKYGLSMRKKVEYDSDEELEEKVKKLQAKVRLLVMEQVKLDGGVK